MRIMGRIAAAILITAFAIASIGGVAHAGLESALASANKIADSGITAKPAAVPTETGLPASEVLRGNGGRAGYVLGHGNVIPGSEWVYVGLKRATVNKDYTIDYDSGSLFFIEPVRQSESVRIDYRYQEKSKGERNVNGPGVMPLKFAGGNLQTNLTYSYRAADPEKGAGAPDILTYGLSNTMSFAGSSSLQSMFYVATPQTSNRLSLSQPPAQQKKAAANSVKKDRLILQNADFSLGGKARLKLGFQDVGEGFAGISSLRDSKAAPDDVLNQLEKEKGINRMSIGLDVPTGATAGLSFSATRIKDKQNEIFSQAFGYTGSNFRFSYSNREVGKQFSRFKDIREADAAQMAAEAGVKRTGYLMQFKTGTGAEKAPLWSGLNFIRLQGETGELSYRSVDVDTGKVRIQADVRTMDPQFSQMTALNDEERTRMAQIARRQFNPYAQASEVTAKDKAQINQEAGINRKSYSIVYDNWLSIGMGNREAPNGSNLDTTRFGIDQRWGSIYFYHHRIDTEFDRISALQPVEIARFGNETGMNRTDIGGTFKLGIGELGLTHGNVTDHQGASVMRESIDLNNTRVKFHANFQDIDPSFSRTNDLSDGDKKMLAMERGFRRSDYSINFQATRDLNLDTYLYNSTNVTAEQTRSQRRHRINFTPPKGPKFSALTDDFSYISEEGNLSSYSHRRFTLENKFNVFGGLLFKGLHDVNTTQDGEENPVTTQINQTHVETDQNARTAYTFDTLSTDYGDGKRFENFWDVGAKTRVSNGLAFTGGFSRTDREENNGEMSGRFGFEWSPKNDLALMMSLASRKGRPKGSQRSLQFSAKGTVAKKLAFLKDITVDSGISTNELKGKQVSCDNGLRLNAGLLGGKLTFDNSDKLNPKNLIYYSSRMIQYESDPDPKKKYHLTFFRQNLVTPSGEPARKRNYALDVKISRNMSFTMTSYFGKDGKNGAVLPVGGGVFKISRSLGANSTLFADFTTDRNESTNRFARTAGIGFIGTLSNKASVEFYYGWSRLFENGEPDHDNVFRIKYDHKIDADHFLSLTAQKKSAVDRSSINPFEGYTTARIDFRTVFN